MASNLGLRCLPMTHKKDARLIWVKGSVLVPHMCEELVAIPLMCEELVPIHIMCEKLVPILHM